MIKYLLLALLLTGCSRGLYGEQDYQVLCSLDNKAYYAEPGAGDTTFLRRTQGIDKLCTSTD